MPPSLAPTLQLATPKVEKFVQDKLMPYYHNAQLERFYAAEPGTSDVENYHGQRWIEGSWGAEILADSFNTDDVYYLDELSNAIKVGGVEISVSKEARLSLRFWLCARVFRH